MKEIDPVDLMIRAAQNEVRHAIKFAYSDGLKAGIAKGERMSDVAVRAMEGVVNALKTNVAINDECIDCGCIIGKEPHRKGCIYGSAYEALEASIAKVKTPQDQDNQTEIVALKARLDEAARAIRKKAATISDMDLVITDLNGRLEKIEFKVDRERHARSLAENRVQTLEEALTPSENTKAEYIGEFKFPVFDFTDDGGNEEYRDETVPWAAIKEIMGAIKARADRFSIQGKE